MYDKFLDNDWHIDIEFDEDETHTHATVRARMGDDDTMTAIGDAFRNPKDISQPMIGEEIAAARALITLGTDLLHRAGARIEAVTRHPVHLINMTRVADQPVQLAATAFTGSSLCVSAFICLKRSR